MTLLCWTVSGHLVAMSPGKMAPCEAAAAEGSPRSLDALAGPFFRVPRKLPIQVPSEGPRHGVRRENPESQSLCLQELRLGW